MLLTILYWLAVAAVSLALVVALVLFLEARDQSAVGKAAASDPHARVLEEVDGYA